MRKHTPVAAGFDEAFNQNAERLPGANDASVREQREQALKQFVAAGLPSTGLEDWKYTSLDSLKAAPFTIADRSADQETLEQLIATANFGGLRFVFIDGFLVDGPTSSETPEGLSIQSLASQLENGNSAALTKLPAQLKERAMVALNAAFMTDGVDIDVSGEIETPVHLLFLTSGTANTAQYPRINIHASNNARIAVIEHYLGRHDSAALTNTVTHIATEAGAEVKHYKVQDEAAGTVHVGSLITEQNRDSRVISHSISLGASIARHDIDALLSEPGSCVVMNGLYLASGDQHVDNHTRVEHISPHTSSEEDYRGVIADKAHAVFNGRVHVYKDAQKTDASQSNRNLLLSSQAEIDTKPELEIYADDVKCAHGATVGQLDDKSLFYLRSRGIDKETARALLTFAFADDVINRIEIPALRDQLEQRVLGKMPDAQVLEAFV